MSASVRGDAGTGGGNGRAGGCTHADVVCEGSSSHADAWYSTHAVHADAVRDEGLSASLGRLSVSSSGSSVLATANIAPPKRAHNPSTVGMPNCIVTAIKS